MKYLNKIAFLGKRRLQDYTPKSNWKLIKKAGENGWTKEFMEERGLTHKNDKVHIIGVLNIPPIGGNFVIDPSNFSVEGSDTPYEYWVSPHKGNQNNLILMEIIPSDGTYEEPASKAMEMNLDDIWDGKTQLFIAYDEA